MAVEADLRGISIYAQDIQLWAVVGLQTTLDRTNPEELKSAGARLLQTMTSIRRDLYGTECPNHGAHSEVIHTYWVRNVTCPSCHQVVYLYPHNLLTYAQRVERETANGTAYFGCAYCGQVSLGPRQNATQTCLSCGMMGTDSIVKRNAVTCPRCHHSERPELFLSGEQVQWTPVLVQRLCNHNGQSVLHLDLPTVQERNQAVIAGEDMEGQSLSGQIPVGKETRRLVQWGLIRWKDLYPGRQLTVYLEVARRLAEITDISPRVRQRLLLAICGSPEMAGYVSRWDRYHLKAFEATANHRFSASTFTVEVNPLGPRGRGTLPRRIMHSVKAAAWSEQAGRNKALPATIYAASEHERTPVPEPFPAVVAGSSEFQRLGDSTVRLVLTDPPYYDDVQYAELAAHFNVWAEQLGLFPTSMTLDTSREAVPNRSREESHYESLLRAIFSECRRTLSENGRLVFTFHNTKLDGWVALGCALRAAGFQIIALAAVHAENETDHSKRNKKAFSKDLILECRVGANPTHPWTAPFDPDDHEAVELTALGMALARATECSKDNLWRLYTSAIPVSLVPRIR